MQDLGMFLDAMTARGELYLPLENGALRCTACAHRCLIRPGKRGICQVRFNQEGELRVPWGYVAALQADPIEKKPFSHVLPGATALTFGMLGCDLHCEYCQNWLTSQAMRDPASAVAVNLVRRISAEELVSLARRYEADVLVSSYNEPLITSEWSVSIFKKAKAAGLLCAFVSNGNATPEALEYLRPWLDAYKVDLKSMQEKNYRRLGAVLKNVLDSVALAHALGLWVEVVTLIVPGFNDSNDELYDAARFLHSVSADIPWHVTAFHPDYKMTDYDYTSPQTLLRAAEIGREAGLRYVYAGNLPGLVEDYESTHCPACNRVLIKRRGYVVMAYHITENGACPYCGTSIAGVWPSGSRRARLHGRGMPVLVR
ncbi:MAG: AmmeMemoRadiSam system radical SAM enzyme [Anaerolineae bacterium]|nr:MAG: AmmeMemoRadiSam system radical SAM enzyme [Anaerolineae bacterium]